jgi:hypothetical protein
VKSPSDSGGHRNNGHSSANASTPVRIAGAGSQLVDDRRAILTARTNTGHGSASPGISFPDQAEDVSRGFNVYEGAGGPESLSYISTNEGISEDSALSPVLMSNLQGGLDQSVECWFRVVRGRIHW